MRDRHDDKTKILEEVANALAFILVAQLTEKFTKPKRKRNEKEAK